jgi:hypothetical protein
MTDVVNPRLDHFSGCVVFERHTQVDEPQLPQAQVLWLSSFQGLVCNCRTDAGQRSGAKKLSPLQFIRNLLCR